MCNAAVWVVVLFGNPGISRRAKAGLVLVLMGVFVLGLTAVREELRANLAITTGAIGTRNMDALVRPPLYVAAFEVAKDHFPFGSGPGTFASVASMWQGYSDLYYKYGIARVPALSPELAAKGLSALYDSFWVHILAELGFLGSAIYLLLWFLPAVYANRARHASPTRISRGLLFYVLGVCGVMTVEGIATYNPEVVSFVVFHSGIAGLIVGNVACRTRRIARGRVAMARSRICGPDAEHFPRFSN